MVGVAQLVEHWFVVPVVVGSSPIVHPILVRFRVNTHQSLSTWASVSSFRYLTPRSILGNSEDRPNAGVGY